MLNRNIKRVVNPGGQIQSNAARHMSCTSKEIKHSTRVNERRKIPRIYQNISLLKIYTVG